jgi:cellulose synthase/poly-beta-1,6-N-acetylglucosamine synthase-like glycosyltransferase
MSLSVSDLLTWIPALLLVLATLPGTFYLLVITIAGMRDIPVPRGVAAGASPKIAIIVPAHNEAAGIFRTLENLCEIARRDGAASVVVIADNCCDDTAAVARANGARVLERRDESRRGKGYALDYAFRTLASEGFYGYVVIDADSVADASLLSVIRKRFAAGAQVVQTRYTVLNADRSPRTQLFELALCAFNCLRPRGRQALGLSAGILGNGFALRQAVLEKIPYTATSVVEDLEYHLNLVKHSLRVHFADETVVRGEMPVARAGQGTQRARWEGGRLRMLLDHGGMLARRTLGGQGRFLEPLLDLLLLPQAYHTLLLLALLLVPAIWAQALGLFGLLVLAGHVTVAARIGGVSWARLGAIVVHLPVYLWWKLVMLRSTLMASQNTAQWIRTDRDITR